MISHRRLLVFLLLLINLLLIAATFVAADMFSGSDPSIRIDAVLADPTTGTNEVDPTVKPQEFQIHVLPVAQSPQPDKNGQQGLLYDRGADCSTLPSSANSSSVAINLPPKTLPKIAFLKFTSLRPAPVNTTDSCTPFKAVTELIAADSPDAIIISSPDPVPATDSNGNADLGFTPASSSSLVPVYWVPDTTASVIQELLADAAKFNAARNTSSKAPTAKWMKYPRAILYPAEKFFPGVWEFTLIVVVVLLTLSFATSVAMHCHLYRVRRRQRQQWAAFQAANGGRRRRTLLDKSILDSFPVITYTEQDKLKAIEAELSMSDIHRKPSTKSRTSLKKVEEDEPVDLDSLDIIESASSPIASSPQHIDSSVDTTPNIMPTSNEKYNAEEQGQHDSRPATSDSKASLVSPLSPFPKSKSAPDLSTASMTASSNTNGDTHPHELIVSTCAVCLDDFEPGDVLRQLPCGHRYHRECIDPWLTEKSSACPMCKADFYKPPSDEDDRQGQPNLLPLSRRATTDAAHLDANQRGSIRVETGELRVVDAAFIDVERQGRDRARTENAFTQALGSLFPFHALRRASQEEERQTRTMEMTEIHQPSDVSMPHTNLFARYVARRREERRRDVHRRRRTGAFVPGTESGSVALSMPAPIAAAARSEDSELALRERSDSPARVRVQEDTSM